MRKTGSHPYPDNSGGDQNIATQARASHTAPGHRIRSLRRESILFALAGVAVGYLFQSALPSERPTDVAVGELHRKNETSKGAYAAVIEQLVKNTSDTVRVRLDSARGRLWLLASDHVAVYDTDRRVQLHRIALPVWTVADFICAPDLALDAHGRAYISNNVQPIIVQIDLDNVRVIEHRLDVVSAGQAEIGFGALRFTPEGVLLGVSALGRTLWKIDLAARSAEAVHGPPEGQECDMKGSEWSESRLGP